MPTSSDRPVEGAPVTPKAALESLGELMMPAFALVLGFIGPRDRGRRGPGESRPDRSFGLARFRSVAVSTSGPRENAKGMRECRRHLLQHLDLDVADRIAGLVIARVVRASGGAPEHSSVGLALRLGRSRVEAERRDILLRE